MRSCLMVQQRKTFFVNLELFFKLFLLCWSYAIPILWQGKLNTSALVCSEEAKQSFFKLSFDYTYIYYILYLYLYIYIFNIGYRILLSTDHDRQLSFDTERRKISSAYRWFVKTVLTMRLVILTGPNKMPANCLWLICICQQNS